MKSKQEDITKHIAALEKELASRNYELEIQAALESVRDRTMAMQRSGELKEVIQVVYQQFSYLNIPVKHTGFIIDYKAREDMHIWLADQQAVPSEITIPYFDSPHWNSFKVAKATGKDFFANSFNFEEKNRFYKELFKLFPVPEQAREFYFGSPGVDISTVLLDNVGLYIENFSGVAYTDEENKILMRFGKVFQQTYTRFLELEKAEAQSKEVQIELALERTRTQSMLMQHSTELDDTLRVFHEQVLQLAIPSAFSFLWLPDEANDQHIFWAAWAEKGPGLFKSKAISYPLDRNEPATAQCLIDWKSDERVVSYHVPPAGVADYFAAWLELISGVEQLKPEYFNGGLYYVEAFMKYGCFGVIVRNGIGEDEKKILERFAREFERTYTRFLDLQKAEAQTRESQIELSLERVRAKTMAMHNSGDVGATAAVMTEELKKLGIETIRCGIGIMHEPGDMEVWTISREENDKTNIIIGWLDMNMHPLLLGAFQSWRKKIDTYSYDLKGEDLLSYYNAINNYPGYPIRYETSNLPRQIYHNEFHFTEGTLFAFSLQPLTGENRKIFKRFAAVFGQTYRRYLDLKNAEAQAREAQIETSLERVRSRTLAMQKSDELAETSAVLFKQLIGLGISPSRLYISILKDDEGETEFWITDEQGSKVSMAFEDNLNNHAAFKMMFEGWKLQKKSLIIDMKGKELADYFKHLTHLGVPFKDGLEQKRRIQHLAFFNRGFIGMASPDDQPAETIHILERFAAVFNLTFTRFNDLKIAEAHALQAQQDLIEIKAARQRAEETLKELQLTQRQLIQSEKMASLGELTAGIAHEIQNPLNFVNNFSEVSKELIDEMKTALENGKEAEAQEIANDVIQNLEKINHHGKRADAIVKGMLQHSRRSAGQKELTDINALCDEYIRLCYHGVRAKDNSFNAAIETDYDTSMKRINAIPQDIGRVLLNVLTNAFYEVRERQNLQSANFKPCVSLNTKQSGDHIEIRIEDNGRGIPANIIDKIFQPFFTTKPTGQGTGLGLSLAYDIITKEHGGVISVHSRPGEGTVFMIELPVYMN